MPKGATILRILLLEDDPDAMRRVAAALAPCGADLVCVARGEEVLRRAASQAFDVIVLDRMNEGLDGLEALRRLRALDVRTPVLALSNLGSTRHRIEGLDAGADDYLGKPFDGEELVARLNALVRRSVAGPHPEVLVLGALEIRVRARTVHWQGRHIDLSPKEFEILRFMGENAGAVVSRQMIWNGCWPEYHIPPQINVIDVNLSRLRAKLEQVAGEPLVQTIRKQGFVLPAMLPAAAV